MTGSSLHRLARLLPIVVVVCCSQIVAGRHATAADMTLSATECANLKILVDDAVFDFENRQGRRIDNAHPDDSKFASKLLLYEVTGSTAPFGGCQLSALSEQRVSTDRSLRCKLIDAGYRSETLQITAESSQRYVDLVKQTVTAIGACLGSQPAARTWASEMCGDACTHYQYRWRLKLVPPTLDVIVEIEADIPDAGATMGQLSNEFDLQATIRKVGP